MNAVSVAVNARELDSICSTYLVLASCSDSNVFCALSSSISESVTSCSRCVGPLSAMGGVTPRYFGAAWPLVDDILAQGRTDGCG